MWGLPRTPGGTPPEPRSIPTRVGTTGGPEPGPVPGPVHPHACGDYFQPFPPGGEERGPSPRVWGLPLPAPSKPHGARSIPTRVGTTLVLRAQDPDGAGPSPRVWGLLEVDIGFANPARSIPTRVGTTRPVSPTPNGRPVHPHACGDYLARLSTLPMSTGPSPRVWGLPVGPFGMAAAARSIPTRVGTTGGLSPGAAGKPVHPHACGDYGMGAGLKLGSPGPSPRVWGLRGPGVPLLQPRRSIPTRVGTTRGFPRPPWSGTVHPHACGDYGGGMAAQSRSIGPSPRVWGLRGPHPQTRLEERSIPTRVGTTLARPPLADSSPVHPHACGDYT